MHKRKNKVFVGPGNIAGLAMQVAQALKSTGIDAKSFSYRAHPFGYTCDHDNILLENPFPDSKRRNWFQKLVINKISLRTIWIVQKAILFTYASIRFDTFIFISHDTFFNNNKDLWYLQCFKKKIAFLFVGCPERDPSNIINQTDRGFCSFCTDEKMQRHLRCYEGDLKKLKIEHLCKYAEIIFAQRDSSSFIKDANKIRNAFCSIDFDFEKSDIMKKFKGQGEIKISHLPSNSLFKGTDSVLLAIAELKKSNFQFSFFSERIKNSEIKYRLKETNILIDQFSVGHGLLSIEGMAMGCVVICRTAKWFKEDFPELPLVSCEPEELADVLISLISNPDRMLEIALKSYDYYQKYHTPEVVGEYYKKTLQLV